MSERKANRALPVIQPEACCATTPLAPRISPERAGQMAERLKALADPTRLRMLDLLAQQAEPLCVCDITAQFAQNQPTISHHLRILREEGLAAMEKRGVWSYWWATAAGRQALEVAAALD